MKCVLCGLPIEEGRRHGQPPQLAKYCLKCRGERRRSARLKYLWRPDFDEHLKAHYCGGLNRRFRVLNRMIRLTGLPRWYIKRRAARLGLTMHIDRKPWTATEVDLLERLVGNVSPASIATVDVTKQLSTKRKAANGRPRPSKRARNKHGK